MPLYVLGFMGVTRRMDHYDTAGWQPISWSRCVGALVILAGVLCQMVQLVVSIRDRNSRPHFTGDPWNGRTLEWSTTFAAAPFNFAVLPVVA